MPKRLIVISGPTGIGKTRLSLDLASEYGCEIFSADSRQIYKSMDIGTAKPTSHELASIKHHFIDEIKLDEPYNVGLYADDINKRLVTYFSNHDIGIIVGGTGLYIHAALNGIDDFPDIPTEFREDLNSKYINEGLSFLQEEAKKLDPAAYENVDKANPRRLMRIIEVSTISGQPYSSFASKPDDKSVLPYEILKFQLSMDRGVLYERINERVDSMINNGLIDEVKSLIEYRHCQSMYTVGYREVIEYLDGLCEYDQMIENIKTNSRRYAKRQETWLKKYYNGRSLEIVDYDKSYLHVKSMIEVN